jgi:hypothetical protein
VVNELCWLIQGLEYHNPLLLTNCELYRNELLVLIPFVYSRFKRHFSVEVKDEGFLVMCFFKMFVKGISEVFTSNKVWSLFVEVHLCKQSK